MWIPCSSLLLCTPPAAFTAPRNPHRCAPAQLAEDGPGHRGHLCRPAEISAHAGPDRGSNHSRPWGPRGFADGHSGGAAGGGQSRLTQCQGAIDAIGADAFDFFG